MRHRSSVALLAFGLVLPLAACSDDDDGGAITEDTTDTTAPPAADDSDDDSGDDSGDSGGAAISIEGFAFTDATVAAGAAVEVANADGTAHTVSSDDDAWEAVRLDGGASGSFDAPADAGDYAFHCDIHPTMTGTLTVE
jgi:plastocyanin